ncbi:MAG TPA: IS110 family transposase [Thermodesulfobacteriota bacterium]|nr:IS110 family transposase [Thermodesulfobacteriota bacterium]
MRGLRGVGRKRLKEGTLIATVDIGLTSNTGYCTTLDGRDIKPFRFDNTQEGFERFWCITIASKNRFGCDEVVVGYESTGPYAEPLVHYLGHKGAKIVQVNPLHTKKMKEINDNSPLKTDEKDPRVIADIIRLGHALTIIVPEGDAAYLRRLNNARERHVGEQTALLNQLQQLVFLIFPEFKTVLKNLKGKTAQYILRRYTTPEKIATASKELLGEEMRKRSMGQFGVPEAESLIGLARQTVGIKEGLDGLLMDIRHILMQLEAERRFISEIEAEMGATLERLPFSGRLLSIKGLGIISVAGLIGEVGDFSKFRTQSEIMKLAGLDLYEISSGKRKGQRRISKRGRGLLRKILFYAAIQMIRKNGIMYDYYVRLTGRGMERMRALIAVSRKLLRIIHALMRDNSDYVEQYQAPERILVRIAA